MPNYTYELDGDQHTLYAPTIFEAAEEIYATTGQDPEYIKEDA